LNQQGLLHIWKVLQNHHSRDPKFLRKVQSAMAAAKAAPWKCGDCRRMVKGTVMYCPGCGQWWENCIDSSYPEATSTSTHRNQTYTNASWEDWQSWGRNASQSPRRRQQRPQSRRGKGNQGRSGKGKGKGEMRGSQKGFMGQEGMAPLPPPPIPPYMSTMDTAWMQPPPPYNDGKTSVAPDTASQAESKLRQVLATLKKNETELPPDVAQMLKDTSVKDGKMKIKGMHEAVEVLGKAHAALEHACHERAQNLATWRQFLHQSVQRWQEYTERFQHQERVNLGAIGQAREELKQAQQVFKELQDQGIIAIDAEDDPAAMDSEMVKEESSMKIQVGLQHLTKSLQDFAQQADQEHAEEQEQMKKRPRKEEALAPPADAPMGGAPASTSAALPSMQPFGKAHGQ